MSQSVDSEQGFSDHAMAQALVHRLDSVRARIAAAAQRVGRSPEEVRLLPVSKTFGENAIRAAATLGLTRMAENRDQEIQHKHGLLADCDIDWVMIGHLQTNKVKHIVPLIAEIQTLDRLRLAVTLDRRLQREERSLDVLVQVKTSPEPSKYGLMPEELVPFVKTVARDMPSLRIRGLMTMAIHSPQEAVVRQCFQSLRQWRDRVREEGIDGVEMERLSMGMSGDFEIAIEEGATEVRLGTALFGERTYNR